MQQAAYVAVDGPWSGGIDRRTGAEFPVWSVCLMTDDDEELKAYTVRGEDEAIALGQRIARDRHIELVIG